MLLAIDVGNTEITLGVFEGEEPRARWHLATRIHRVTDEYAVLLMNLLQHHNLKLEDIKEIAICCVVPPLLSTIVDMCQRYFNIKPFVVGAGVKTGVRIRMDNPREVGADRIVNAAAAHRLYGGPVIITDFGTATTFDVVSKEGDYLGGVIAPGIGIAAEALFIRAAMLPRVELARPNRVIGSNTTSAMQSGIVYGYIGLVEGIVARIQKELGEKTTVIATGGFAEVIASETNIIKAVNQDITLIGLRLIYDMNQA
jgi:type III pantothenate kinase